MRDRDILKVSVFAICVIMIFTACYKDEVFNSILNPKEFIYLKINPDTIHADGYSKAMVEINIPEATKNNYDTIRLSATNGKFPNGNKSILVKSYDNRNDSIDLKIGLTELISTQSPGVSLITAQVGGYIVSDTIFFARAYPEKITTILPSLTIGYGYSTIKIATKLSRKFGFPSENTTAIIKAEDANGNSMGQFLNKNETSDLFGNIANEYSLGIDSSCNCDKVFLITTTQTGLNSFITDTVLLIIN